MLDLPALLANEARDRGWVAIGLSLLDDDPAFVDHADARTVQRYVDPDEELHGTMLQRVENPIVGSRDVDGKAPARSAHLNRQSDVYAREGIELDVSTLADWVGACSAALAPLVELIRRHVLAADRIHGDDTTVPVLAHNKTVTGRLWTYVRDDRPFGGTDPPAAMFFYSRDRGGEHPRRHLSGWTGTLQADAYAGFGELYQAKRSPRPITEAACWAHGRRKFFVLADLRQVPLAIEAVRRVDEIFAVEREINGVGSEQRHAVRQERIEPL